MIKQLPTLKVQDNKLIIEGDFKFELSPTIVTEDSVPMKKISFLWCPELSIDISNQFGEEAIIELFAEKLKQDFIKCSKEKLA